MSELRYCITLREYKEIINSIFGTTIAHINPFTDDVCGFDITDIPWLVEEHNKRISRADNTDEIVTNMIIRNYCKDVGKSNE